MRESYQDFCKYLYLYPNHLQFWHQNRLLVHPRTVHLYRTLTLNHLFPTLTQSLLQKVFLWIFLVKLHHHEVLHGDPILLPQIQIPKIKKIQTFKQPFSITINMLIVNISRKFRIWKNTYIYVYIINKSLLFSDNKFIFHQNLFLHLT